MVTRSGKGSSKPLPITINKKGNITVNIIEIFTRELQTDCCDTDEQSVYLKAYYDRATQKQKDAINEALIALCGWSFETLLKLEKKDG